MSKRKNYGFKGGKKLSVYVGTSKFGSPRSDCIEGIRDVWNHFNEKWFLNAKREVRRITFQRLAYRSGYQTVAQWKDKERKIIVNDTGAFPKEVLANVILHEAAHAWYDKQSRINPDAIKEFQESVMKLSPITYYTLKNRGKWSEWLYANEIHSAIVEVLFNKNVCRLVGSEENLNSAVKAFKKLHEMS